MLKVLITGSNGFIGKNLYTTLAEDKSLSLLCYDTNNKPADLSRYLREADFIFHLAGVNRPIDEKEFKTGNTDLTQRITTLLEKYKKQTPILMTSSTQAILDNPYGKSKKAAEDELLHFSEKNHSRVYIYRLPNVFGKWCRPNYNSVVATFCYNTSHNLPISVNDPAAGLTLAYIDDVIEEFVSALGGKPSIAEDGFCFINRTFTETVQGLADRIQALHKSRLSLIMPSFSDDLNRFLFATYTSYLEEDDFSYKLKMNTDERGWLAEIIKSPHFGQMFVSKTRPGVVRGNHWHHTKIEKFIVIEGDAKISFRNVSETNKVISYNVSGKELTVLDVPVGYSHSITNTGKKDLITLFWTDEMYDCSHPDTYYNDVEKKEDARAKA